MTEMERRAFWLLKQVNPAIRAYAMLQDGDRVAVAVSGGKDSLSLLRLLDLRRKRSQEQYELLALHVSGDASGPFTQPHAPLVEWLDTNQYAYHIEPLVVKADEKLPMNCQRCTWNRRRTLFLAAQRLGCNVLAFGHHADDLAETALLNLLHHGALEAMAPVRSYFDGTIRLIRPLCLTSEAEIRRFARACAFPDPPPACPQSDQSARRMAKDLLRQAERAIPGARANLLRAGLRGLESSAESETEG